MSNHNTYIIYPDNEIRQQRHPVKYSDMNANKHWLTHYSNSKYLTFFSQHETTLTDRLRALHELTICQRKMDYWKRHPNWDLSTLTSQIQQIDKEWSN
jgi:hypothetical protein